MTMFLERIPRDPLSPEFRQGNTLGPTHRHWFRAKFGANRFRLFYRADSASRIIVYACINDRDTLRKAGASSDPYAVFAGMLERGNPPATGCPCSRKPGPQRRASHRLFPIRRNQTERLKRGPCVVRSSKLPAQAFTRGGIPARHPLPFHVAALRGCLIENVVGGLNQVSLLKLAQKIACADQADTFIDDGTTLLDIAVLEQQQRFRGWIAAKKSLQYFDRRLLAEPTDRAAFFKTPLLINPNIGRNDPDHIQMRVNPFHDLLSAGDTMNACRFDINGVRDADG